MTASAAAARVRLGKPNSFDATAMMVDILAQTKDSGGVKQVVRCLVLIGSNDRCGTCTDQSISLKNYCWRIDLRINDGVVDILKGDAQVNVTYTITIHVMLQACEAWSI